VLRKHLQSVLGIAIIAMSLAITTPRVMRTQTPNPESTVIYACYVPGSGLVYRVKETHLKPSCSAPGHVLFSWNAQGPAGPPGPPGGGAAGVLCPEGQFLRGFDDAGAPVCAEPSPSITVIAAASPMSGVSPLMVQFDCRVAGGDGVLTFAWNFGDGSTASSRMVTHTYDAGEFVATCTVVDADGDQGIDGVNVRVDPDLFPNVSAAAAPGSGTSPLTVNFSCAVSGGNTPLSFAWDFGDGTVSGLQNPTHTYHSTMDVVFEATCTVVDQDGDAGFGVTTVSVAADRFLTVNAVATPASGAATLVVQFGCTVVGGNAPFSFAWDFGDGTTGGLQNPTHAYAIPGTYTATCTVTDADGDQGQDGVAIAVLP